MPDEMNNPNATPAELLEAYLDHALAAEARDRFEQAVAIDPCLRREVELQEAIDAGLRRAFGVPSEAALRALLPARLAADEAETEAPPAPGRAATGWMVLRRFAVAAALAGGVFGSWLIWESMRPTPTLSEPYAAPGPRQDVQTIYREAVAAGLTPDWVCETESEFTETFRARFGQGLRLGPLPPEVVTVGLSYRNALTPQTVILLARRDTRPVLVFIDRARPIHTPSLPEGSDLRLHHRQVGTLTLYELSPLEESTLLPAFSVPEGGSQAADD
jgi:hypothetical protein